MIVKFDVFFEKDLGVLCKDNTIITGGKIVKADLDLSNVHSIIARFNVGGESYDDLVEIVDIENKLIRIPFKTDVIKKGVNKFELIATMKDGGTKPSQTYVYEIAKSLENPHGVQAETNYPILIKLLQDVGSKIDDVDEAIAKVDVSIEEMKGSIDSYKDLTDESLRGKLGTYKENTDSILNSKFVEYSNATTKKLDDALELKKGEVDNRIYEVDEKINEVNEKIGEIDEKVDRTEGFVEEARDIKDQVEAIKDQVADGGAIDEIVNARGDEATLGERLDNLDLRIESKANLSFLHKNETTFSAHRCYANGAPENSIKGIRLAGKLGYSHVELDLRYTRDGVPILMHDATLDRTTSGSGNVSDYAYEEIKKIDLVDIYAKEDDDPLKIPTLEEALIECRNNGLGVNLDLSKCTLTREQIIQTVKLLKQNKLWDSSFFVAGDVNIRDLIVSLYADANITWLSDSESVEENIKKAKKYINGFVSYNCKNITDDMVKVFNENDIPVHIYGCNSFEDCYRWKNVRLIETDYMLPGGVC